MTQSSNIPPDVSATRAARARYYTAKGKVRKVVLCPSCGKMSLRLVNVNRKFMSGNGYRYECSCGISETKIL